MPKASVRAGSFNDVPIGQGAAWGVSRIRIIHVRNSSKAVQGKQSASTHNPAPRVGCPPAAVVGLPGDGSRADYSTRLRRVAPHRSIPAHRPGVRVPCRTGARDGLATHGRRGEQRAIRSRCRGPRPAGIGCVAAACLAPPHEQRTDDNCRSRRDEEDAWCVGPALTGAARTLLPVNAAGTLRPSAPRQNASRPCGQSFGATLRFLISHLPFMRTRLSTPRPVKGTRCSGLAAPGAVGGGTNAVNQ